MGCSLRRLTPGLVVLLLLVLAPARADDGGPLSPGRAERPNIVLIMVDDMGFSDVGAYGAEVIETPHIDRLAARGVRFTQFYNHARCSPTRASLMTGQYPHRAGMGFLASNRYSDDFTEKRPTMEYQGFLNERTVTIAEALRQAGYQTFMSGKWHMGARETSRPRTRGFDRFYGILGGATNYFRPDDLRLDGETIPQSELGADYYVTDAFTDHAMRFIEEGDRDRPFFLYLAYTAPHWPLQAPNEDIAKYEDAFAMGWDALRRQRLRNQKEMGLFPKTLRLSPRHPESYPWTEEYDRGRMARRMAVYAAMMDRVDQNVGRLMEQLDALGETENTLVVFLSDNGACAEPIGKDDLYEERAGPADSFEGYLLPWANASNTPFRLFKHWVHEGGVATPLIAAWEGQIPAGTINRRQTGHVKDLMATFLDAAGAEYPATRDGTETLPLAGRSVLPAMRDPDSADNAPIFFEHEGNRAVRDGRWKLVSVYNGIHENIMRVGTGRRTGEWELYDMRRDRTELEDLSDVYPARTKAMQEEYERWADRVGVVDWETIIEVGGYHRVEHTEE